MTLQNFIKNIIFMLEQGSRTASQQSGILQRYRKNSISSIQEGVQRVSFGSGRYSRFIHEMEMRQRARQFISRIRKEKAHSRGMILMKKQQAKQKIQQKDSSKFIACEERTTVMKKRAKTRSEDQKEDLSLSIERNHVKYFKMQPNIDSNSAQRVEKDKLFAKRFRTLAKEQLCGVLPPIQEAKELNLLQKAQYHRQKQKKQSIIYLPSKLRVKLLEVNQKLKKLEVTEC